MQIEQIIVRPSEDLVLVQHRDNAGRAGTVAVAVGKLDEKPAEGLKALLADCEGRLPAEPETPPQTEVEQEIAELEYRLEHLRKSLGAATPIEAAGGKAEVATP